MKIGIVGGGMTGLSAAYYLSKKGHKVTLFEKNDELGGLLSGIKISETYVEKYYHHLLSGDRFMIELIKEVGLGERLVFKKPPTAIFYQGQTYPFTSALDLLNFSPISFFDRLRFGLVGLYLKAIPDGRRFSSVTAEDWLKKFYGPRSYKLVWEPLLRSKFGDTAKDISMAWFWSRVHDRSFSLGYLRGGFQLLAERLREEIGKMGSDIKLGTALTSITSGDGFIGGRVGVLYLEDGRLETKTQFDKVVVTAPLPVFLQLVGDLSDKYKSKLGTVRFRDALSMILVLKESFMRPYWLNVNDITFPFVAVVEHTNFAASESYGGKHILYVGSYLDPEDQKFEMANEELLRLYLPYLKKINPEFRRDWIEQQFVFRGNFAQPIITTDYAAKIPAFETPVKNVYLATLAQVYPHDRGMNQAVKLGKDVAKIVRT